MQDFFQNLSQQFETFFTQFPVVFQSLNVGFLQTLKLFCTTLLGALPLGLVISFGSMSKMKVVNKITRLFVWIVRGSPLMLQLLIIYYFPGLVWHKPIWGGGEDGRFLAATVAFIINYACYFSEIFRGGIQSIPVGQYEAGQVLGLTKTQTFFRVVLLQVIKRIVPPITNEIITLVKDTSLAQVISVMEMFTIAKQIANAQSSMVALVVAGVFYYVFNFIVAVVMEQIEKKLDYYR